MSDEAKPKTKRKTKAERAAEIATAALAAQPADGEVPPPPPPPEDGEEVLDGVFVIKDQSPDGSIDVRVVKNGNLGVLEVESLLKLGLKRFQEQMGFS